MLLHDSGHRRAGRLFCAREGDAGTPFDELAVSERRRIRFQPFVTPSADSKRGTVVCIHRRTRCGTPGSVKGRAPRYAKQIAMDNSGRYPYRRVGRDPARVGLDAAGGGVLRAPLHASSGRSLWARPALKDRDQPRNAGRAEEALARRRFRRKSRDATVTLLARQCAYERPTVRRLRCPRRGPIVRTARDDRHRPSRRTGHPPRTAFYRHRRRGRCGPRLPDHVSARRIGTTCPLAPAPLSSTNESRYPCGPPRGER